MPIAKRRNSWLLAGAALTASAAVAHLACIVVGDAQRAAPVAVGMPAKAIIARGPDG